MTDQQPFRIRPKSVPVLAWLELNSHHQPGPLGTDCQVYDGYRNAKGYGRLMVNGERILTHRLAWAERHGPIPAETPHVLHRCDNPPCFADDHLWLGTHDENMADRNSKGRCMSGIRNREKTHCPQGHEYSPENTRLHYRRDRPGLSRSCITCGNARRRDARLRNQVVERLDVRPEDAAA